MNKIFFILLILFGLSCNKKSSFPIEPKITYNSMSTQILKAGSSNGGTVISIYVEDGDGDIGSGTGNLYFKDSRDGSTIKMTIPTIPTEYSPDKGIKGMIEVGYLAALLTLRPDTNHLESDTLRWEIYLQDQAGHVSNTVVTDDLILFK
jgi:hypothetical protein